MDLEAPVDAWYVWIGVALVSAGLLGVVLGLPSQPPPDATEAANAIDRVAGSTHQATASYEHDADEIRIETRQISMRNDGGTAHASIAFGSLTPVSAVENRTIRTALERVLHGQSPERVVEDYSEIDDVDDLLYGDGGIVDTQHDIDEHGAAWRSAADQLRVRKVELGGEAVILIVA